MTAEHYPRSALSKPGARSARVLPLLAVSMALGIVLIAAATIWDAELQHADALDDFSDAQTTLAASTARTLAAELRIAELEGHAGALIPQQLLNAFKSLEVPGELAIFIKPPSDRLIYGSGGRGLEVPVVLDAIARREDSAGLTRQEAQILGLMPRMALVAFHSVDEARDGWTMIVASSASRPRDRRTRGRMRALIGVLVPATLILAFGGALLRRQRRDLDIARQLEVAEAQRQADERLASATRAATTGTLAMGIAHEISTPLGAIVGRAEQLLERLGGDEKAARAAQIIMEQADHIHRVVRGILDLAHGGVPEMHETKPDIILRGAADLVEHRFAKANVSLELNATHPLHNVRVNLQLFEHALVNLLLNACDASKPGSAVHGSVNAQEPNFIEFVILDRGSGISEQDAARVMEPFFTTKPMGSGSGLGLAIANEVVKSHRGTLTLQTASGGGTEARLRVPVSLRQGGEST